jgi:osmotically-inducible protein OsmY
MVFTPREVRAWLAVVVVAGATTASGCREQPAAQVVATTQQPAQTRPPQATAAPAPAPESEADRAIRRELDAAIDQDQALKDRPISFTVEAGDITVTGAVSTEAERQKINELALQINGVKSVANALRVSPGEGGN